MIVTVATAIRAPMLIAAWAAVVMITVTGLGEGRTWQSQSGHGKMEKSAFHKHSLFDFRDAGKECLAAPGENFRCVA